MLLKFHKPQSGQIYISGKKLKNISAKQIRAEIGIFDEKFCLVEGTVYDNLAMVEHNLNRLHNAIISLGLEGYVDDTIYNLSNELNVSQEVLIRLQIARIALRRPKVLLINTPAEFASEKVKQMFYDFVTHSAKRHTVLLITKKLSPIVYSSKILYIGKDECLFGTHAELSNNKAYQRYIAQI